jgi:peroxiredoxin
MSRAKAQRAQGESSESFALFASLREIIRMAQLALVLGFAKHELRQGWRSAEFWVVLVIAALATAVPCAQQGTTAALAGYVAGQTAITILGFLAMIWLSLSACRDVLTRTESLILSKPSSGEFIVLGRFFGNYGVVLLLLIGQLLAGAAAQTLIAKTPFVPMAYVHAFERSLIPLYFVGALAYGFSLLFSTPVTGLLVITYWISVLTGKTYLTNVFNCALSQNNWIYLCIGSGVLTLTAVLYHPKRRGAQQFPTGWILAAVAFLLVGALSGVRTSHTIYDLHFNPTVPLMEAIRAQHLTYGLRAPGFWLPDQRGRTVGLEQYQGKVLIIGLWSPAEPGSADLLNLLSRVQKEFPREQVVPVAIGISDDHAVPRHVALDSGFDFPAVTDIGARVTLPFDLGSPLASAYDAEALPTLVITDRRRIVVHIEEHISAGSWDDVRNVVHALMEEQF